MKLLTLALFSLLVFSTIELEKRNLLNNKIEILVPKDFKVMTKEILDIKYPRNKNRPSFVLTNDNATVNIAFSHLPNPASQELIETYKNSIKNSFRQSFPTATWIEDGVRVINGKKVGFLKLISEADEKIYNYLFLTDVDKKLLMCTFNCKESLLPEWEATAAQIVNSLKVK